jgi:hypothetical protein
MLQSFFLLVKANDYTRERKDRGVTLKIKSHRKVEYLTDGGMSK